MAKVDTDTSRGSIVCSTQAITRGEGEQTRKFQRNFRRAPNFPKMAALHLGMDTFSSRDTRDSSNTESRINMRVRTEAWKLGRQDPKVPAKVSAFPSPVVFPKTITTSTRSGVSSSAFRSATSSLSDLLRLRDYPSLSTSMSSISTEIAPPRATKEDLRWRFSHEKAPLRFADQKALYRCCGRFASLPVQESSAPSVRSERSDLLL
jgi:hypothetical protein